MSAAQQRAFPRSCIVDLVLATDVTTTIPMVHALNRQLTAGEELTALQLQQLLIKTADISNPSRPLAVYQQWTQGVMSEFFAQGDSERLLGLPISMNCDRSKVSVDQCQVWPVRSNTRQLSCKACFFSAAETCAARLPTSLACVAAARLQRLRMFLPSLD